MADKIEELAEFQDTVCPDPDDEMWLHTYNAVEMLGTIIIQSDYCDHMTNDTSYFIYDKYTDELRKVTELEDEIIRDFELEKCPWLELEQTYGVPTVFIICREKDGSITRGDKE